MKSGNVNHVAAFEKLVGICNDLGARYNPSKAALTTTALATLLEQAQQQLEAVNVARVKYTLAINHRQELNAGMYPLVERVVRALSATGTTVANLNDARLIRGKLTARSMTRKLTLPVNTQEGGIIPVIRTVSYQDYDSRVNVLAEMIQLLQGIPSYAPNEPELQVETLNKMLAQFRLASQAIAGAANTLAIARMQRNQVMIGTGGLHQTGTEVKEYIRSVFGIRSEPARLVGKLRLAA